MAGHGWLVNMLTQVEICNTKHNVNTVSMQYILMIMLCFERLISYKYQP